MSALWEGDAPSEARPDDNPKSAFGVKKPPLHLIPPAALAHEAMAMADGAAKYGPYNWRENSPRPRLPRHPARRPGGREPRR